MVERRVGDQKVADTWFDSRAGNASLCPWKRHLNAYFPLKPRSLPALEAQPDERLAIRTQKGAVRWCGWTDAECLVHTNELGDGNISFYKKGERK